MAQTELEQIALAMMMMAEDPERRRQTVKPMSTSVAVASPKTEETKTEGSILKEERAEGEEGGVKESRSETTTTGVQEGIDIEGIVGDCKAITNPNSLSTSSTPSPSSPAGSLKSSGSGSSGANTTRRTYTNEFKRRVFDAFTNDPECIGNQRATARKFNIHRRQVQKWLQQLPDISQDHLNKEQQQPSSDEQEQKAKTTDKETNNTPLGKITLASPSFLTGKKSLKSRRGKSKMPIVAGKGPQIPQASAGSASPSANLPSSASPLMNLGKHPLFSNIMGLAANPLLPLPLAQEASSKHSSPNQSPPTAQGRVNGSPTKDGALSTNGQKMLELVDELCYLYPQEDFSLLRKAMIKNEVSFTKLSPPPFRRSNGRRRNPSSPGNDYITQQTLQMIKNQNEYLQLLQSGYANLSHFQDLSDPNSKYASWLNPFAAVAAAGYGFGKHGNNGDSKRKSSANDSQHNFASPKAPVSNHKNSKTVAAVLAATRNGSSSSIQQPYNTAFPYEKMKRPSQRRKPANGRTKPICSPNYDDFLDPTSVLEVVTSRPSPNDNGVEGLGMDLSASSSVIQRTPSYKYTSTIRSKAMSKDYGFLSELGLIRKGDEGEEGGVNGHSPQDCSATTSLEQFVDNVLLAHNQRSPTSSSNESTNSIESSKNAVLEAFNFDSELAGDARGVARKFGLNIRVVQKWIRETPIRSIPAPPNSNGMGGGAHSGSGEEEIEDVNENLLKKIVPIVGVNKRKNPKPNQICDFAEEDDMDENVALDMVVPIKKRRLSNPNPTPTSA